MMDVDANDRHQWSGKDYDMTQPPTWTLIKK